MRVLPFGDAAVLAEFDALDETMAAFAALDADRPEGVLELVPAARTVLVRIDPRVLDLGGAIRWLGGAAAAPAAREPGPLVTLAVRYDGPDLTSTADLLGLSVEALIARHTGSEWTSAFVGFAPGFAYLAAPGLDLEVPRLATSRERVPAGAVGLAGEFTGVYPRVSPGGWRLIGTTDAVLWDAAADPPARLAPGTRVRFEAVS